jgi:hypothetical protein
MALTSPPTTTQGPSSPTSSTQGLTSSSILPPSASSSSGSSTPSSHKSRGVVIAGGLAGASLGLALLAMILVLVRRKARSKHREVFFDNGVTTSPKSEPLYSQHGPRWPMNAPTALPSPYQAYSWRHSVLSPSYVTSFRSDSTPISSPNYRI